MKVFLTVDVRRTNDKEKLSKDLDMILEMTKAFEEAEIEFQVKITNLPPRDDTRIYRR